MWGSFFSWVIYLGKPELLWCSDALFHRCLFHRCLFRVLQGSWGHTVDKFYNSGFIHRCVVLMPHKSFPNLLPLSHIFKLCLESDLRSAQVNVSTPVFPLRIYEKLLARTWLTAPVPRLSYVCNLCFSVMTTVIHNKMFYQVFNITVFPIH